MDERRFVADFLTNYTVDNAPPRAEEAIAKLRSAIEDLSDPDESGYRKLIVRAGAQLIADAQDLLDELFDAAQKEGISQ